MAETRVLKYKCVFCSSYCRLAFSHKLRKVAMSLYNVALGVFFCGPEPKVGLPGREDNILLSYFFQKPVLSEECYGGLYRTERRRESCLDFYKQLELRRGE